MGAGAHILVVDGDWEIRTLLERYLLSQGFRVSTAADGRRVAEILATAKIDLIVLDVMLSDVSGLDLCRSLRERAALPIILLSALREDVDRITGLELGVDNYLGKPFSPRELLARIRAMLPRVSEPEVPSEPALRIFRFAGFTANPASRRVIAEGGQDVSLTAAEFDLLLAFLERPGRMLSRNQLLDITQGRDAPPFDRSIDVLVSRLRRKLGEKSEVPLLKTQRNGGYQLIVPVEAAELAV